MFKVIKNIFLNPLFPSACLACNKYLAKKEKYKLVCTNCFLSVPLYNSLFCPICLHRLNPNQPCHRQALYDLASACHYNNPTLQKIIWQFKYQNWLTASEPLSDLLMSYWHSLKLGKDFLVMPVPLYPHREMKRGFNQAAVLANILSRT